MALFHRSIIVLVENSSIISFWRQSIRGLHTPQRIMKVFPLSGDIVPSFLKYLSSTNYAHDLAIVHSEGAGQISGTKSNFHSAQCP